MSTEMQGVKTLEERVATDIALIHKEAGLTGPDPLQALRKIKEEALTLKTNGPEDKAAYEVVVTKRKEIKRMRTASKNRADLLKADALKYQRDVNAALKLIVEECETAEEHLQAEQDKVDNELERRKREEAEREAAEFARRVALLTSLGCSFNGTHYCFEDLSYSAEVVRVISEDELERVVAEIKKEAAAKEEREERARQAEAIKQAARETLINRGFRYILEEEAWRRKYSTGSELSYFFESYDPEKFEAFLLLIEKHEVEEVAFEKLQEEAREKEAEALKKQKEEQDAREKALAEREEALRKQEEEARERQMAARVRVVTNLGLASYIRPSDYDLPEEDFNNVIEANKKEREAAANLAYEKHQRAVTQSQECAELGLTKYIDPDNFGCLPDRWEQLLEEARNLKAFEETKAAEAKKEAEAKKSDAEKVLAFAEKVRELTNFEATLGTFEAIKTIEVAQNRLLEVADWLTLKAETL